MDIKDINKLAKIVKENELTSLHYKEGEMELCIEKSVTIQAAPATVAMPHPAAPLSAAPAPAPAADSEADNSRDGLVEVVSPIVGTFYRSPSPEQDPFVNVGSEVQDETVVCIVEAMKVMNEIHAETSGIIREILVDNATPVQFGQPLFLVEPR
jgi:acetyl-CoA carboxylase biotin carboxyl carrier protein